MSDILFFRRQNPELPYTFQSMCTFCHEVVGDSSSISELINSETRHYCVGSERERLKKQDFLGV